MALIAALWLPSAWADNAAIVSANNQASINLFLQYQNLNYQQGNSAFPLYNLHGMPYGLNFDVSKTFSRFYTAIDLTASNASLAYNNNASLGLSKATSFVQQISGRLGYSFYPRSSLGLTPYLMLGYQHWQLDTGGVALAGVRSRGITEIYQTAQGGLGLLAQWEAKPRWVLGLDLLVFDNYHTWAYTTIPIGDAFYYQQATLGNKISWQAAVNSDYKMTGKVHGLLGVKYTRAGMGFGQASDANLTMPAQQNRQWQYSAGFGYELDATAENFSPSDWDSERQALVAANNEARLQVGCLFQDYGEISTGVPGYDDRQTGEMPQVTISLNKTWRNILAQVALSEAAGHTQYNGSDVFTHAELVGTIPNTMTDLYGRLGYQFFFLSKASITPYGIAGYHRWLRSIEYPETYHNNWAGLGALLQWAPTSRWVLSLDGNTGNTFNSQIHTWNTFEPPNTVLFESNLGSRTYVMAGAGSDLQFAKVWHILANINYWRFNYGKSAPVDAGGAYEPTSNTRFMAFTLGLAYSLN